MSKAWTRTPLLLLCKKHNTDYPASDHRSTGLRTSPLSAVGTLRTRIYPRTTRSAKLSHKGRKATHGVGGSSSGAPSLNRDDRVALLEDAELESARESMADSVVDLDVASFSTSQRRGCELDAHRFAIPRPTQDEVGRRTWGSSRDASGSGGRSARSS